MGSCNDEQEFLSLFFPPVVQNLILICFMWRKLNFLLINHYERKRNIDLTVSAFARLHSHEEHALQSQSLTEATLTIAGKSQFASLLGYITHQTLILMSLENVFIPVMWCLYHPFVLVVEKAMHLPLIKKRGREGWSGEDMHLH